MRHFRWMQGLARYRRRTTVATGQHPDRGGLRVQGAAEYGYGVAFQGRKADVHKTLISCKVHSGGHVPVKASTGGEYQQGISARSRANLLGYVRSRSEVLFNERSMRFGLTANFKTEYLDSKPAHCGCAYVLSVQTVRDGIQ